MSENKNIEYKSLRFLKGKNTLWDELAKDCVCFANAQGGFIFIGIEDRETSPPVGQIIEDRHLPEKVHKEILNRTINVGIAVTIEPGINGYDYIKVQIFRNNQTIAATTDGRYYARVHDVCRPVPPDEMARLAADKNAYIWEEQTNRRVRKEFFDPDMKGVFLHHIRTSARISRFVSEMGDAEILEYYNLQKGEYLTNLGVLWIGKRADRASLLFPPAIQVIRYDENDEKVWKYLLDDYSLSPLGLLDSVINDVPDWEESIEVADGMFRKNIPFFPLEVVRELVANALVHRTYTMRGDIFINIYPDRLEIHSPGGLPYGVTPQNILTQSVRRNEHLSKIFYDLGLMEREGSGYDLIYSRLLGTGKPLPVVKDSMDRVSVTVRKQFVSKEIVHLMDKAQAEFKLRQKEVISLGLLSQHQSLSAAEIGKILNQDQGDVQRNWIGNLLETGLVEKSGKGKGTQYSINPEYIRRLNLKGKTTLKNIEDYRLEELIYKDVNAYPFSSFGEIHSRIGLEINQFKIKRMLKKMSDSGVLGKKGTRKFTKYFLAEE